MAVIRPFRGLRFGAQAGPLDELIAPPYDVLTPDERNALADRNDHNVVRLTLPESKDDDRSKYVKYLRSSALLAEWRRESVLSPEAAPAIYRYIQRFRLPGVPEVFERTAILALIKVRPYSEGVVLPHEQTFPKHKEDRLRILEATRAHLEPIFGLYEDPGSQVLAAIQTAPATESVSAELDGIEQVFEPITDPEAVAAVVNLLSDKKVWIADGHHRYETALAFREALGERDGEVPEDYMMMALSSMSDPGLVLLPTHRIVSKLTGSDEDLVTKLTEAFLIEETSPEGAYEKMVQLGETGQRAFSVALRNGKGLVLTPENDAELLASVPGDGSSDLKGLDVTILHSVILEKLLGIKGLDAVGYTRNHVEALRLAESGSVVSFLMNPPSVDDMKRIALGGEKMPQKSTFYYPKLASGLVLWSLNDF